MEKTGLLGLAGFGMVWDPALCVSGRRLPLAVHACIFLNISVAVGI